MKIHGLTDFESEFMEQNYPEDDIKWDFKQLCIYNLDIECRMVSGSGDTGFPDPLKARNEITAITIHDINKDHYYVFIHKDGYKQHLDNITLIKSSDERVTLNKFVRFLKAKTPDIITGWNIDGFDIPYLVNRITNLFDEDEAKNISPLRQIRTRQSKSNFGEVIINYTIVGIECLDYLQLYKKYKLVNQESYALDFIAELELGEKKLDYSEYDNLDDLYFKNFQKYVEYNIHDTTLVTRLEAKLQMLTLHCMVAYMAKVNFADAMGPVNLWTHIIYHALIKRNIVFDRYSPPPKGDYLGGYVKDPQIGMHDYVVTFDAASLYPSIMLACNTSPETKVAINDLPDTLKDIYFDDHIDAIATWSLDENITKVLKEHNYLMAANGQIYYRDKIGIVPEMVQLMLSKRKEYKSKMLSLKKKNKTGEYDDEIAYLDIAQSGTKVAANALYGALGNQYFVLYDLRNAAAITSTGQAIIQAVSSKLSDYISGLVGKKGDYVGYCDTDSTFLLLNDVLAKFGISDRTKALDALTIFADTKLSNEAERICTNLCDVFNAYKPAITFKREKIISRIILLAKKRYIGMASNNEGVQYDTPQLFATGVETKRSSTPQFVRNKLEEAFELVLTDTEDKIRQYVKDLKSEFFEQELNTISFPKSANNLEQYQDKTSIYGSGTPMQVRAALVFNHHLKRLGLETKYKPIRSGDKIKLIFLKPNPFKENVIGYIDELPKEFKLDKYIDYDECFVKAFLDPLESVIKKAGWDLTPKASLSGLFGD
jgi:DNA polymerase elongation subunit (family B)